MQNRKDLLQAHRLMTQRAALALVCGEPDAPNQPLRRLNIGAISSVLVGAILAGVFVVLGLLSPGNATGLTRPGTLVVDKETATALVPCHGQLCPALNYASALLALGTPDVNRVEVSPGSLSRYQIGPTIGIPGLPQILPSASDLVKGPWSVCTQGEGKQPGPSTLVGGAAVGGTPLNAGHVALVTTSQGDDWVLWNGQRLLIQSKIMKSFFTTPAYTVPAPAHVPVAWLDALPRGSNFAAPAIAGIDDGQDVTGPDREPAPIGQIYTENDGSKSRFVLLATDKVARISATQAALVEDFNGQQTQPSISPTEVTRDLSGSIPLNGLPANVPSVAAMTSPLCVVYGQDGAVQLTGGGQIPAGAVSTGANTGTGNADGTQADDGLQADMVWLPPGHGALVGASAGSGRPAATSYYLVSSAERYGLSSQEVAQVLGYSVPADSTVLPASVLDLIPLGPALDPATAVLRAPPGG